MSDQWFAAFAQPQAAVQDVAQAEPQYVQPWLCGRVDEPVDPQRDRDYAHLVLSEAAVQLGIDHHIRPAASGNAEHDYAGTFASPVDVGRHRHGNQRVRVSLRAHAGLHRGV